MALRINLKWLKPVIASEARQSLDDSNKATLIAPAISVHLMRLDGAQDKEAAWRMNII